jgi:hypothetical protein
MLGGPLGRLAGEMAALGADRLIRNALQPRLTERLINRAINGQPLVNRRNALLDILSARGAGTLTPPMQGNALANFFAGAPRGAVVAPAQQQR